MAEEPQDVIPIIPIQEGHPPATLLTIFADGVPNLSPSPQVAKFYLYRTEAHTTGAGPAQNQIVAQVVMPVPGFLSMVAFFDYAVENFIKQGTFSQKDWDAAQKVWKGK
jgi:hypothetical protein